MKPNLLGSIWFLIVIGLMAVAVGQKMALPKKEKHASYPVHLGRPHDAQPCMAGCVLPPVPVALASAGPTRGA